jgi:hypothetical protein
MRDCDATGHHDKVRDTTFQQDIIAAEEHIKIPQNHMHKLLLECVFSAQGVRTTNIRCWTFWQGPRGPPSICSAEGFILHQLPYCESDMQCLY